MAGTGLLLLAFELSTHHFTVITEWQQMTALKQNAEEFGSVASWRIQNWITLVTPTAQLPEIQLVSRKHLIYLNFYPMKHFVFLMRELSSWTENCLLGYCPY